MNRKIKNYEIEEGQFIQLRLTSKGKFYLDSANIRGIRKGQYHKSNGTPIKREVFKIIVESGLLEKERELEREVDREINKRIDQLVKEGKYFLDGYVDSELQELEDKILEIFDNLLFELLGKEEYKQLRDESIAYWKQYETFELE